MKKKSILITGAYGGMGKATAKVLVEKGFTPCVSTILPIGVLEWARHFFRHPGGRSFPCHTIYTPQGPRPAAAIQSSSAAAALYSIVSMRLCTVSRC